MGRSTSSEICPNVAFLNEFGGLMQQEDDIFDLPGGWKKLDVSTYGELYPDTFEKNSLQVNLVNMDLYSNGGGEDWVVFSDDIGAVQTFLADQGIQTTIHNQEAVHQTL